MIESKHSLRYHFPPNRHSPSWEDRISLWEDRVVEVLYKNFSGLNHRIYPLESIKEIYLSFLSLGGIATCSIFSSGVRTGALTAIGSTAAVVYLRYKILSKNLSLSEFFYYASKSTKKEKRDPFCITNLFSPILEESIFRCLIQCIIFPYIFNKNLSILSTSLLFSYVHRENYFDSISSFVGGLTYGWLYENYGIVSNITAHVAHNLIVAMLQESETITYLKYDYSRLIDDLLD